MTEATRVMRDERHMRRALALAARAKGNTSPNPMVGAVVVSKNDTVVGEAFHERAGALHAEAIALEQAGDEARGGTLYVTLEPCDHHGRTPPCTDAILRAGIARVVTAREDEDERVRGAGIRKLLAAGIEVDVGIGADAARALNRRYAHHRRTGRPYLTLKMAQSIDGAIGARPGERRQLTGAPAAAHVRALRYEHDAVMVGIGTALVDDPQLTVRPFKKRSVPYVRVVVDSNARLDADSALAKNQDRAATIVAVSASAPQERIQALTSAGVEVLRCASDRNGRVDLLDLLQRLGQRGMLGVLCEGGPMLAGALFEADLVDELHLLVAPVVLGTAASAPAIAGVTDAVALELDTVLRLGQDTLLVASRKKVAR